MSISAPGEDDVSILVVSELPTQAGDIEVFSNGDCSADGFGPQAENVTDVVYRKHLGRSVAFIPLLQRGTEDGFTVTFTDSQSGTSQLSNCVQRQANPSDGDGDGSPDAFESGLGLDSSSFRAVHVTPEGTPVLVSIPEGAGQLRNVGRADTPAPPAGVSLPYGAVSFEVESLSGDPLDVTSVSFIDLESEVTEGDSYYKFGPAAPGAAPSWFEFGYDEESGTGARSEVVDTVFGLKRAWQLDIADGGRGDDDGVANGRIVDPGGPALLAAQGGGDPGTPVSPSGPAGSGNPADPNEPTAPDSPTDPNETDPTDPNEADAEVSALVPIVPVRLLDTRTPDDTVDRAFPNRGRVAAGSVTDVQIAGRGGVATDAEAVAVTLTVVAPDRQGYVTLFPCDGDRPETSSLNHAAGQVVANSAVVQLSPDGRICVFSVGEAHLVLDVNAYFAADGVSFGSLVPARLVDTRPAGSTVDDSDGVTGRRDAGSITIIQVAGRGGVPADASAVAVNVTAIRPDARGYLTLFPCGIDRPETSSLNYDAGDVVANSAVVALSDQGTLCAFTLRATHLVLDVNAWISETQAFDALPPARIFESRSAPAATIDGVDQGNGRLPAVSTTRVQIAGRGGVSSDADAVAVNITAIGAEQRGFATFYPCDATRPHTSSINFTAGSVVANSIIVKLDQHGAVCAYTLREVDLALDVNAAWGA